MWSLSEINKANDRTSENLRQEEYISRIKQGIFYGYRLMWQEYNNGISIKTKYFLDYNTLKKYIDTKRIHNNFIITDIRGEKRIQIVVK